MAIKKSELYCSLWKSCDELRGGMDASQYKDYVLVLLFVKYVSDKYAGQKDALLDVPAGRQLRRHGGAQGRQGDRRQDQQDHRQAGRGQRPQGRDRRGRLQRRRQAGQGQGDGGPPLQPGRHLRQSRPRLPRQPRRGRRPAGRCLRIPDAPLRHRVGQEQGAVLHPGGGLPHHGQGHRHRQRQVARPDHLRPHLRLRLAAAQGPRRSQGPHRAGPGHLRAGDGQRHRGPGQDEHDPARLPHGGNLEGQHPLQPPLQGANGSLKTFDFVVANPPFSTKAWSNGFDPANDALWPLRLRHPARQERRLCLPAPHPRLAQEHAAKARSFCRTACCSGAAPRPTSARTSSGAATSRASSACRPTCSTAPASPPASSCWTRKTPPPARASS